MAAGTTETAPDEPTMNPGHFTNAAETLLRPALNAGLGDRPAILFDDQVVTYAELDADACRFGNACLDLGLRPQDRVLMVLHDRPYFFSVYLGAMKIGAVPIAFTLRASAHDLEFAIVDSGCRMLLIDHEYVPLYEQVAAGIDDPPQVIVCDADIPGYASLETVMAGQSDALEPQPMDPDAMAFWMYTSGTTGTPKGAVHRQSGVAAGQRFLADVLGLGASDRVFCSSKLFFAFSIGHCLFGALPLGMTTILFDGWPNAEAVADVVERHRPDALFSVPTLFRGLLAEGLADGAAFKSVRYFVAAGEKLPDVVFDRWREATGKPITEGIGATENAFLFLANRPGDEIAGSCGWPIPGTDVRLVADSGEPVTEADAPGVLWVRSPSVAAGYWHQEDKTRAAFEDGWYRTGDVFTQDADGRFRHQGRADDMLKVSGQWVSPGEIEDCVQTCPGVAEAVVVGAANHDGLVRLMLFVQPTDDADTEATETAIRDHMLSTLAVYKCPRRIAFVDEMPRTPTGKVQRFRLRETAADIVGRE